MSDRRVVAFDTETELFSPGRMAPPLVCISYQREGFPADIVHAGGIDDRAALELVESWLTDPNTLIVGHHVCFDNAVLCARWPHLIPHVFRAYDEDRVTCTKIRQQLLDIAGGCFRGYLQRFHKDVTRADGSVESVEGAKWHQYGYDLDAVGFRATGRHLKKDEWRLRYGEFRGVPISSWPKGAREYPLEDARMTLEVFQWQEQHRDYLDAQWGQARAAWALQLTSIWGLKTHGPAVERLEIETIASLAEIEDGLKAEGLVRKDGTRDTKRAQARMARVCQESGRTVRLTDGGVKAFNESGLTKEQFLDGLQNGISLDANACEASEDPVLVDYADLTSLKAVLNKDIPILKAGILYPVHTSFGMAATLRVTSSKPNVQNPRRLPGIREAFIPREGKVYAQADFSGLELHTLAQVCWSLFGFSTLREVLNNGLDAHTDFAAGLLGITYEEADARKQDPEDEEFANARQSAKIANFGFGGGMGADAFVSNARGQGCILTVERAKELKAAWLIKWPETQRYFQYINQLCEAGGGEATVEQLFTNQWRAGCKYCAAANTFFQNLGAQAAKRATYLVSRACYAEPDSVMYGSRIVNTVHDELIVETDDVDGAHDVAIELGRLMILGANEFLPDVPARVEPLLARCWSKKAKPRHDARGRLVPWSPS